METLQMSYESTQEVEQNSVKNSTEQYKNEISKVLSQNATEQLSDIFWLTKEQTEKLSNENEVNTMEAQLAKIMWKYNEMLELEQKPFSLASVMDDYEEYEKRVA